MEECIEFINGINTVNEWNVIDIIIAVAPYLVDKSRRKKYRKKRWWESELVRNRPDAFFARTFPILIREPPMFRNYFRMSSTQFEYLVNLIGPCVQRRRFTNCRHPISVEERLALTLRYLASGDSQISMAYHHQVGKTTVSNIIYETCSALWLKLKPLVLAQPSTADFERIAGDFESTWNFPHCIGAIDGKHVEIEAPPNTGSTYYNYLNYNSIVLLAMCDSRYRFTLVDIGANGRQSDGGIFSRSIMGRRFREGTMGVPRPSPVTGTDTELPYVVLGDQAFALSPYLLRPFPERYGIDVQKRIFNYRLSRARRVIENTFGIVSSIWRILRGPILGSIDTIEAIVLAIVCLHNFLIEGRADNENFYFDESMVDRIADDGSLILGNWRNEINEDQRPEEELAEEHEHLREQSCVVGARYRQKFAEFFEEEGALPWQNYQIYM